MPKKEKRERLKNLCHNDEWCNVYLQTSHRYFSN